MRDTADRGDVLLWAAGSLVLPLEKARCDLAAEGIRLALQCGPSGTLRQRIEGGARPDIFLSAARAHIDRLVLRGLGQVPRRFCGNRIVALLGPSVPRDRPFLDLLLAEGVTLATSTPLADPSGDYAWSIFDKAETLRPGAREALKRKVRLLAGGPGAPSAPEGTHHYGWIVTEGLADVFLTYASSARQAVALYPELTMLEPPPELAIAAEFWGLRLGAPGALCETVWEYIHSGRFAQHLAETGFEM